MNAIYLNMKTLFSFLLISILLLIGFVKTVSAKVVPESAYSQYVYAQVNRGSQVTLNLGQ